jgi:hypothetical protein
MLPCPRNMRLIVQRCNVDNKDLALLFVWHRVVFSPILDYIPMYMELSHVLQLHCIGDVHLHCALHPASPTLPHPMHVDACHFTCTALPIHCPLM